jgi:hypothetical protein
VGNTDAEGRYIYIYIYIYICVCVCVCHCPNDFRMVMSDLLCLAKEEALTAVSLCVTTNSQNYSKEFFTSPCLPPA